MSDRRWLRVALRRILTSLTLLLLAEVTLPSASAAATSFDVAPEPTWITSVAPAPAAPPEDGTTRGRYLSLYERQVRVGSGRQEAFTRHVQRITNESGLQLASQVDIGFDPSFQTLTIHTLRLRRGEDAWLDRLDRQAIRLVQREQNLDAQVYDGEVSAVMFIPDVRVGDTIEVAYTIGGSDPTLQGKYADGFPLGADEPIGRVFDRLLMPESRHVETSLRGPAPAGARVEPVIHSRDAETEYVWDLTNVHAFRADPSAPASFESFPWLQASEFRSWQEVAALGAHLFESSLRASPGVAAWVKDARAGARTDEAFILHATRFVQDEVRYVAIEVGMSRRRPSEPDAVLARRYGDCKDKTALLVAMLRTAGIKARPALVSSKMGRTLDAWGPSGLAFDHAIVKAFTSDARTIWIDPTSTLTGGGVDRLRFSPFERALDLDLGTTALDAPVPEPATEASPLVRDRFQVGEPGTTQETLLESERTYRAGLADAMRASLRWRPRDQVRKDVRDRYQTSFPAIRDAGDMEVDDDREGDVLRLKLHFALPDFWQKREPKDDGAVPYQAEIAAHVVDMALLRPTTGGRTAPLGLPYPLRVRYEARLALPFELNMTPEDAREEVPALRFSFASTYATRKLSYVFEVDTRAPEVALGDLDAYVATVDKARAALTRNLIYPDSGSGQGELEVHRHRGRVRTASGLGESRRLSLQPGAEDPARGGPTLRRRSRLAEPPGDLAHDHAADTPVAGVDRRTARAADLAPGASQARALGSRARRDARRPRARRLLRLDAHGVAGEAGLVSPPLPRARRGERGAPGAGAHRRAPLFART